jgi:membrane dipeptidase
MIVDTGHCGRQTTLDACAASTRPVISSHASAAGVFPHVRAKSDEEIEQIAETGGVCGVALVPEFLSVADPASIENYLDHVDYIEQLVGWQHVALGTDWPAPFPASVNAEVVEAMCGGQFPADETFNFDRQTVGFMDYRDYRNITRGLVKRGYADEQIVGVLGGNALRVIEQVCG